MSPEKDFVIDTVYYHNNITGIRSGHRITINMYVMAEQVVNVGNNKRRTCQLRFQKEREYFVIMSSGSHVIA